ncbi:MAG: hypothetical protein WKF76_06965 [Nocardioidaceae bacterium]
MSTATVEFPALKHPIALRLLMGHLVEPETSGSMLEDYLALLAERRAELQAVHDSLTVDPTSPVGRSRFPRMVADWGLDYYESERVMVEELIRRLAEVED